MNNEVNNHERYVELSRTEREKKGWRNVLERIRSWMAFKDKDEWLEQMRGNLGLIATVIATITFQIALNPPGGVRPVKDDGENNPDVIACTLYSKDGNLTNGLKLCPGEAVLAVIYPGSYLEFLFWNSICFVSSLTVLLLLVSGFPLKHRFPMWLLSIGMCLTLTSLAITYITAVQMVTPDPVWGPAKDFQRTLLLTWVAMLFLLALFLTLRFIMWVVNIFLKIGKRAITQNISRENTPAP
ncbi:uncharacterized protein LOC131623275 isoform X2 [Vicia villosa]|nr:uncharacterized protein LOC131623275 isoform X2 [Vicia villosa]